MTDDPVFNGFTQGAAGIFPAPLRGLCLVRAKKGSFTVKGYGHVFVTRSDQGCVSIILKRTETPTVTASHAVTNTSVRLYNGVREPQSFLKVRLGIQ